MTIGALVVTHGKLGEIFIEEAQHLVGKQERIRALSTEGLSATGISQSVENIIENDPWIIFTDAPGTSPTVRSVAALHEGQAVVSGVNLGMLLSFMVHRENFSVKELAERMVKDGKRSLEVMWPL